LSKRQSAAPSKYDPSAPRVSKREQLRHERRRRSFVWNLIVLGTAVAFLAVIAWYVVANQRPGQIPGEVAIPVEGGAVVPAGSQISYSHYPPSSGNHYADAAPWGSAFHASLPVAGESELLRHRMKYTPAMGNLHAKTGTTNTVISLGGYVTAQDGEVLAFSFIYTGHDRWNAKSTMDAMGATLANFVRE
jgi:hypothetical protein